MINFLFGLVLGMILMSVLMMKAEQKKLKKPAPPSEVGKGIGSLIVGIPMALALGIMLMIGAIASLISIIEMPDFDFDIDL